MEEAVTITVQLSEALFDDLATSPEEISRNGSG
jgi:hypothetical protein